MNDRLSPILVKELRQGMRARAFEGSFVILQVLMLFSVFMALVAITARHSNVSPEFGEGLFWIMLGVPILLIMPMRGSSALKSEMDSRSLELIFLTRLTAWRIVVGKWAALFSQTCLLVVAVLPYAVLRYYLGSVDLLGDLVIIGGILGASALLTAFTVSMSSFTSKLARSAVLLFPLVVIFLGPSLVLGMAMAVRKSSGVFTFIPWQAYLAILFYGGAALYYLLELGASRIAPAAENHAIRKRLLAVLLLASGPIGLGMTGEAEFLWMPLILVIPICVDGLARPWNPVPGNFLPLVRWKTIGQWASAALLPGWPSGFVFTVLALSGYGVVLAAAGQLSDPEQGGLAFAALAGSLLMPLAVIRLFLPNVRNTGVAYFVIQLSVFIFTMITILFNELFNLHIEGLLAVFPLSTLLATLVGKGESEWLVPCIAVLACSLIVIGVRSATYWKELGEIRKQADRLRAPPSVISQSEGNDVG